MKYRDLPDFSRLFVDWVEEVQSLRDLLPQRPDADALRERAAGVRNRPFPRTQIQRLLTRQAAEFGARDSARRNIDRLLLPDCAVVLASLPSAFAGGPLSLLLKCLTAAKLAAELEQSGVPAVPVCWLDSDAGSGSGPVSITMLDRTGGLSRLGLKLTGAGGEAGGIDWPIPEEVKDCFSVIEASLPLDFEYPLLLDLKRTFSPGTPFRLASARFFAALVEEWGVVLLDPRDTDFRDLARRTLDGSRFSIEQATNGFRLRTKLLSEAGYCRTAGPERACRDGRPADAADADPVDEMAKTIFSGPFVRVLLETILPVAAHVIDHKEACALAMVSAVSAEAGLAPPLMWPRVSATVIDARSRKIMEKHGITLADLLARKADLIESLRRGDAAKATVSRLESLEGHINGVFAEISASSAPGGAGDGLPGETRTRMLFQLEKLKERFVAATTLRRETIARQVERAANSLAPEGKVQEEVIAGLHFLLHNSSDFSRRLYDGLDTRSFTHQLIVAE